MNAVPAPSLAAARSYLQRLDPEAAIFTFQTFDDDSARKKPTLARVINADPANGALNKLADLNARGAGVFVTVNATDGKGRQEHNVERVRAVFVDLDGAPLGPVLQCGLDPHLVVESSPGRYHAYWRVNDEFPLEKFGPMQRALAAKFDGDPSVHDLPRVLRLPGFLHRKGAPFQSHMVDGLGHNGPARSLEEIIGALQLNLDERPQAPVRPNAEGKIAPGNRHTHLFASARSMAKRAMSTEAVRAALAAENASRCDPPLPDTDIDHLAKRAFEAKDARSWDSGRAERPPSRANEADATRGHDAAEYAAGRDPDGPGTQSPDSEPALLRTGSGAIKACEHNARTLIGSAPQYAELHFDEFLSRMRCGERDWSDADDLSTLCWLQSAHAVASFTLGQARNSAKAVAYARRRDSLREFVESLPAWDGIERIDHAFVDAWGAPDNDLTRATSRNFFIALIARALQPGAQVDTLLVLEGPQGTFKSQSLRVLGEDFHAEITAAIGTADFLRELRGVWLAELSELDALRGREASTIKRILSAPKDRFVQKFALHAESYPRRAVAVATTNEATYWQDPTGARRLVPIACADIRIDVIENTRLQWFAEARHLHVAGATWWEFPASITAAQEERQQVDPWEDVLRDCMARGRHTGMDGQSIEPWPDDAITSAEIMRNWLRLEPHQQGQASSTRLGRVMRRLNHMPTRIGHEQARGWVRADTQAEQEPEVSAEVSADIPL